MTDEEIVKLYLKRDPSAIRHSQLRYGERLFRIAQEITADPSTAEEIENDTYFRAWESIPPKEPYTYLFAFLARIARNLSLSLCREQSRLKRAAFVTELSEEMEQCLPAEGGVEEEVDAALLIESINRFLFSQTEEKRNLFMRRYWFLDSVESIAKRYRLSESKVKVTLFRLRNELKAYLEKEGTNV
ncbi:MAG: RNA polymerase sigma factor [Ruminiclostridium sp.]|nr:RNA polymerase sigma factor [Ruminiclostridium sp.]